MQCLKGFIVIGGIIYVIVLARIQYYIVIYLHVDRYHDTISFQREKSI